MTPMYTSAAEIDFNSQPHKEADNTIMFYYIHTNISTHSLTRRLTTGTKTLLMMVTFQLTASQGG